MKRINWLIMLILQSNLVAANPAQDTAKMEAARIFGEKLGNIGSGNVNTVLAPGANQESIKKIAGYDEQKAAQIKGRGTSLDDFPDIGEESRKQSPIFSDAASREREQKLDEEHGFRKGEDKFVINNKGYLDEAKKQANEAATQFDFISGKYKNCQPKESTTKYKMEEVCNEYYDINVSECLASQVVEIDPKYTYQCTKKREEKHKKCNDVVTLKCINEGSNCNSGGILLSSVNSDMQFSYNYPELTIGTIADNYWGGHCAVYDRSTTFEIVNLAKITDFRITQVGFDDYLWIKVNGQTVYAGPDGGTSIELTQHPWWGTVVKSGSDVHGCERNTNWNFNVNVNLLPYLQEGKNEIWIRVIVAGRGEGWMKILARQQCCNEWKETRETQCELR